MSVFINADMPWFIITFSLMTTLALHGSYFTQSVKRQNTLENPDLHTLRQPEHIYY